MSLYRSKLRQLKKSQLLTVDERIQILELEIDKLAKDVLAYKKYYSRPRRLRDVSLLSDTDDELIDIVVEMTDLHAAEQAEFVKQLMCHESFPEYI